MCTGYQIVDQFVFLSSEIPNVEEDVESEDEAEHFNNLGKTADNQAFTDPCLNQVDEPVENQASTGDDPKKKKKVPKV